MTIVFCILIMIAAVSFVLFLVRDKKSYQENKPPVYKKQVGIKMDMTEDFYD